MKATRSDAFYGLSLRVRVWRGWLQVVAEYRTLRKKQQHSALRVMGDALHGWCANADALAARRETFAEAAEVAVRGVARRGLAAFKWSAAAALTRELAVAAARQHRRKKQRSLRAAFLGRWIRACTRGAHKARLKIEEEARAQAELLAQARSASAAAERAAEAARSREESLMRDMHALQDVLAEHRQEAEGAAQALAAAEARIDEMDSHVRGAMEAQRESETMREQSRLNAVAAREDVEKVRTCTGAAHPVASSALRQRCATPFTVHRSPFRSHASNHSLACVEPSHFVKTVARAHSHRRAPTRLQMRLQRTVETQQYERRLGQLQDALDERDT